MRIELEEKTHTYFVDGEIAPISVTELLHKHGLAPDYGGVDKDILREKAEYGKRVHKDIELYLNSKEHKAETEEGAAFSDWAKENIESAVGEQMLAIDYKGLLLVGTADIMGFTKDNIPFVGDHKTTTTFGREYVSWQLSLLDYMARRVNGKINGKPFFWSGAKKLYCFHYKNGLQVKEIDVIPDEEIERLLDAEIGGEIYQRRSLIVATDFQKQLEEAEAVLVAAETQFETAKQNAEMLRAQLLEEMRRQHITSWETDKITVSYIAPTSRLSVDSKKLKEKYPNAYEDCQRLSKVKDYIKIKVRDDL